MKLRETLFLLILVIILSFFVIHQGLLADETKKQTKKEKEKKTEPNSDVELKTNTGHKSKAKPLPKSAPVTKSGYKRIIISGKPEKYTGEPGTFIFHEADLKNVLLFFGKTYKINIIVDPGIRGKVTIHLINVPWDQALDLILRQHGLGMIKNGNLVTAKKLKKN